MTDVKIERNVPVPIRGKYPWAKMKPGDSFVVKSAVARDSALRTARQRGLRATSRMIKKGQYRLWLESKGDKHAA